MAETASMRVPSRLADEFKTSLAGMMEAFLKERKLLSGDDALLDERFLRRSIVPHLERLSDRFNRKTSVDEDGREAVGKYWTEGSNTKNLRLAYFLHYLPLNAFRMAAVWSELKTLGWKPQISGSGIRMLEWGAGPGSGAAGVLLSEAWSGQEKLAQQWRVALVERDAANGRWGQDWISFLGAQQGITVQSESFTRELTLDRPWLPEKAPTFDVMLSSFFLNEVWESLEQLSERLVETWRRHLNQGGIAIVIEPALREQSRKLLELRKVLIPKLAQIGAQVLLPCLGHQACGALEVETDWCHERVGWWRPDYMRTLDRLTGMDHKELDFSYWVIARDKRPLEKILPGLKGKASTRYRLVSESEKNARDWKLYLCGQDGKWRARATRKDFEDQPERGDILSDVSVRGDRQSGRVEKI